MIKVLHVVPGLVGGGVESVLLSYYRNMDRRNIKFDFIVFGSKIGDFESVFEDLGSKVFHIPSRHESCYRSFKEMNKIIKEGKYDIVHSHQNELSFIPLYFAKRNGVCVRIAHSHSAFKSESILEKFIRKCFSIVNKYYATDLFACSLDAAKWVFGEKTFRNKKVSVLKNAISIEEFAYDKNIREEIRSFLNIKNKFVVGNVGRLTFEKNHKFLIEIFYEIHKIDHSAILMIVGGGAMEKIIKEQVKLLGLDDYVYFMGVRKDIPNLMQAMDVFLLPTMFEGFGIAYLEAQASGLISFGTNKVVPKEVRVTEKMHFIDLEKPADYWANEVLKYREDYNRKICSEQIRGSGYDILEQAKKLEVFYGNKEHNKY